MRIVTWNMAYWKPSTFKAVANRRRQWSYLLALSPDIALLQECRPTDFGSFLPGWAQEEYVVLGSIPESWTGCSAILARRSLSPRLVHWTESDGCDESVARWFSYLAGYLARAEVTVPGVGPMRIASVHAIASEISDKQMVTPEEHQLLRRNKCDGAWHNDIAASALRAWFGERFVAGGDWNTARGFDTQYPQWGSASQDFFDRLTGWEWAETVRKFYPEETQTYLDRASYPYQLDHLFTDGETHELLTACKVIRAAPLSEMSDHAPIVADYRLPTAGNGGPA